MLPRHHLDWNISCPRLLWHAGEHRGQKPRRTERLLFFCRHETSRLSLTSRKGEELFAVSGANRDAHDTHLLEVENAPRAGEGSIKQIANANEVTKAQMQAYLCEYERCAADVRPSVAALSAAIEEIKSARHADLRQWRSADQVRVALLMAGVWGLIGASAREVVGFCQRGSVLLDAAENQHKFHSEASSDCAATGGSVHGARDTTRGVREVALPHTAVPLTFTLVATATQKSAHLCRQASDVWSWCEPAFETVSHLHQLWV